MERINSPELLNRFADSIDANGIELVSADLLAEVVRAARAVDASPVAIDVLVDPTEPWVARERAFGLVAAQILGRDDRIALVDRDRTCSLPARLRRDPAPAVGAGSRRRLGRTRAQV